VLNLAENNTNKDSLNLAGKVYDVKDYQEKDTLSSGLATTHEQASDAYMEGEVNAVIDNVDGKDIEVKREGYNKESR
jgi:acetolactate synthase small subunit